MTTQTTNQNGTMNQKNQSFVNGNSKVNNKIDFPREIKKQYAHEIFLEKRDNPFLDENLFKSDFVFGKVHEFLANATMAFAQGKEGTAKFNIAYAWAYANFAGINIKDQVNRVYPVKNSIMSFARAS